MIKYVANVVSGRLKHWVLVHNPVVNEFWGRIEKLPPAHRAWLRDFFASASTLLEDGLLEQQWKRVGVDCNLKRVTADQFRALYDTIMAAFVFTFVVTQPVVKDRPGIWDSFICVAHDWGSLQPFVTSMKALDAINPAAFDPSKTFQERIEANKRKPGIEFPKIGTAAWDRIGEILGFNGDNSVGGMTYFSLLFSKLYVDFQKGAS